MPPEKIVRIIDFWLKSIESDNLFPRKIVEKINLDTKEIIDIIGPRRSGKSSILKLIIKKMDLKNNFLFINFEDPFFIENNSPEVFENLVEVFEEYFSKDLKYLFFDEIQEINHWEKAMRKFRDAGKYKIFITGSSSKLLSGEMSSLITGRHLSYENLPISFKEFLYFKKIEIKQKKDIFTKEKSLQKEFSQYMKIGGFPEIALTNNEELLKSYFFDIIEKDIIARYDVREKEILKKIAVFLLSNAGKIFSIQSLKNTFGISFELASNYVSYLKESFLLFELPQFGYSIKKQEKAFKKIYAIDTGIANTVSFRFSEDKGRMLENIVFLELRRRGEKIFYYKTQKNKEIDFLTWKKEKPGKLIQVAWSMDEAKTREREIKSLLEGMDELKLKEATILTESQGELLKVGNKTVTIMPVYKWLLEEL